MKADYIRLIRDNFSQQTKQLIQSSTPDLASLPAGLSTPHLSLVCKIIHNRYGTVISSQLLCSWARWNPPEVPGNVTSSPAWFETPVTQLRSWLAKVDAGTTRDRCILYVAPDPAPKLKTSRYDLMHQAIQGAFVVPRVPQCLLRRQPAVVHFDVMLPFQTLVTANGYPFAVMFETAT